MRTLHNAVLVAWLIAVTSVTASAQTIQWIRQFGTPGSDQAFATAVDPNGVSVVGFVSGALPNEVRVGAQDAFLRRYDSGGNLIWTRQFGTPNDDVAFAVAANAGGSVVVGLTTGALGSLINFGGQDMFGALFDHNGSQFGTVQIGSPANDVALGVALDANTIYFVGRTEGTLPGLASAGGADAVAGRFNMLGNPLWVMQFGSAGADTAVGVAVDLTGVYVGGSTGGTLPGQTNLGGQDAYVRKFSLDGAELWTRQFGSAGTDAVGDVAVDSTGIYVVGITAGSLPGQTSQGEDDAFLRKFDHNGNELWTRQFGTSAADGALEVAVGSTGVYVLARTAGTLPGQTSAGGRDAFVRKFDADGNEQWSVQFGTLGDDLAGGGGVDLDATGIYVAGDTGTGRALPGQTSAGSLDAFLLRISTVQLPPAVAQGGAVNNASYAPSPAPLAPGSIAAIFGSNLNNGSTVLFSSFGSDGKLVTSLGGASVTFNNIPAPMFYSTSGQLGVQVPVELAGQASATLQVSVGGQTSAPRTVFLDSLAPGIFTTNQQGTGLAAVLHQDGVTPVTTANPARRNEVVVFFATGLGVLNPPLATGVPSVGNRTATTPTVTVDGVSATVEFSGSAPGFVGLNQVNVRIPANTRQSTAIPVVLTISNKQSNTVTIPVAP